VGPVDLEGNRIAGLRAAVAVSSAARMQSL
jgi:hypothetical protein